MVSFEKEGFSLFFQKTKKREKNQRKSALFLEIQRIWTSLLFMIILRFKNLPMKRKNILLFQKKKKKNLKRGYIFSIYPLFYSLYFIIVKLLLLFVLHCDHHLHYKFLSLQQILHKQLLFRLFHLHVSSHKFLIELYQ